MGQLYLIRHGKTEMNSTTSAASTDRIRGWENIPLDAQGRQQAKALATLFETKGLDSLYTSDLARAADTAEEMERTTGLDAQPDMAFRPWNLGVFQGEESQAAAPEIERYVRDPYSQVPDGESFQTFKDRFLTALQQLLCQAKEGETVGLVTHYRCVKLAEAWFDNGQVDSEINIPEFLSQTIDPGGVICVVYDVVKDKWVWEIEEEDQITAEGGAVKDKPFACELPSLGVDETRQRIQVFPGPGEYVHPKGTFSLDADTLAEFAENLNAADNINVDRDHAFYKGKNAPAAGWFVPGTAQVTDAGVTAEVEWTPDGAKQVRDREYRYISPEFSFVKKTAKGQRIPEPTLHAATLTNRPFFEMDPIAAEDLNLEDELLVAEAFGEEAADALYGMSEIAVQGVVAAAMQKQAASKQPYGNVTYADPGYQGDGKKRYPIDTEEHARAAWSYINKAKNAGAYSSSQLARIKARIKRAATKFGVTIGAEDTGGNMDLTALAEAAGLAADASEDDVIEALQKFAAENVQLKEKLEAAPSDDDMKTLIAQAARGEKAAARLELVERDTAITAAVREGKIAAAEKEHYEKLWAYDPEGVSTLLAEKPVSLNFRPVGSESTTVPVMGPDGKPLARQGGNGDNLIADTTPIEIDGVPMPIKEDTAKVDAMARDLLAQRGKGPNDYTADEYAAACMEAATIVGVEL